MSNLCGFCKMAGSSTMLRTMNMIILIGILSCLPSASAFGSGNIPAAAYLKGKAWRHGDIEDTLEGLSKVAGDHGGAMVGAIASALFSAASGNLAGGFKRGKKFTGLDVKRIYFGNWLRDLSQVCDIAGFKAMTPESLVICIMTMGFLSFGYATREFQVTRERLSVYLLTEHIDNPKGYAEGEDPRKYDPRLRPPVDEARELRIDERNGMKMYIASEDQGFDTSTACIRRVFRKCIQLGREAQREGNEEKEHESFRLLGTGLHTLEDFSAHSNWCELALQKLGHKEVFAHVGENVKVNSPEGPVPPLVTGTFAGADFCFSMLGEASDKLSSASIADLTAQLDTAQDANKAGGINLDFIKSLMSKLPLGGNSSEVQNDLNSMDQKKHAFDLDGRIDQIAPEELQAKIWDLFKVRDNLMRRIEELIQGIPGLGEMLENLSLSLAQWVMVTIDPFVRPILLQASSAIGKGSQSVISGNDQWTVFNDPNASDPTHSVLAKDHFSNILNDPAGNISVIIVKYTVGLMVEAWGNDENPDQVINLILEAIHHPSFTNRNSKIQREMIEYMQKWLHEMDRDDRELTIKSLTKDSIRNHRNQRKTTKGGVDPRLNGGTPSHGCLHPAFQQASMLGNSMSQTSYGGNSGSQFQSTHGTASPQSQKRQGDPASNYGVSHSQTQYSSSQSQGQHRQEQYDDSQSKGRYGSSQSGYDKFEHNSSRIGSGYAEQKADLSGRFNQSNSNDGYRNESTGYQATETGHGRTNVTHRTSQNEGTFGGSNYHDSSRVSSTYGNNERDNRSEYAGGFGASYQAANDGLSKPSAYRSENNPPTSGYQRPTGDYHSARPTQSGNHSSRDDYEQGNKYNNSSSGTSFPKPDFDEPGGLYEDRETRTTDNFGSGYGQTEQVGRQGYGHQHSNPGFPQAHHGGGGLTSAYSNQSKNSSYANQNSGRYDDSEGSTPGFPQAFQSGGMSEYPAHGGGHSHQPGYETNSSARTDYMENRPNVGRDHEGYGRHAERASNSGRSRSREGKHHDSADSRFDSSRGHHDHRHRSSSKDSKSSNDSHGSKKHKHKKDKHKKNKSPERQRDYSSTYQGDSDRRGYDRNTDQSDYGMNRLNMGYQ